MSEQELHEPEPIAVPIDSKWIAGISPDRPVCEVASRVLNVRLKAVHHFLPLAAQRSDEDAEYVHQLRISVRRAAEALRVFSGVIEEAEINVLRDRLRRIRLAADKARNCDVIVNRFSHGENIPSNILKQIKVRRGEAQGPIVAIFQEVTTDACEAKIETFVQKVESHHHGEGKHLFGRQAPKYLAPVVKKFFKAAESDFADNKSFHALRIRMKKLRYAMEIVAEAFDLPFRKRLYRQITLFQDLLGTVNDHATANTLFRDWRSKSENGENKAFFDGLLLAEERATEDLRAVFLTIWTSKVISGLKRQFGMYC